MKVAIPVWDMYVSTAFDFSDRLLVAEINEDRIGERSLIPFEEKTIVNKAARLRQLGVNVLLCGAISLPLARMIETSEIMVIPFLRGAVDDILDAYISGRLMDGRFSLPGYGPHQRPHRTRGMQRRGWRHSRWCPRKGWYV